MTSSNLAIRQMSDVSGWIYQPLMMAMLSSLFVGSVWGEILTTRWEFKPVLTSYSVLCAQGAKHDLKFLDSVCKSEEQVQN